MDDTGGAQDKAAAEAQDKSYAIDVPARPTAGDSPAKETGRCTEIDRRTRWDPEVVGPEKVVGGDD